MESSSSDALLGGSSKTPGEKAHMLQVEERVCGTGSCGFSDEKSRVADAHARSAAAKKLGMAIVLCLIFIAVEVAGGLISNSLAILTDAAHLLSDVAGFAISLFAIWASSWEATPRQSYGFFRLEILGALLSVQLIWLLTGIIVYEAVYRLTHTSELVNGRLMFFVATFGLCVNIIMVFLLGHHGHNHSHDHGHAHGHSHGDIKNITSDHGHVEDHYHDHSHDDTHDHGGDHHGHDHDHNHNVSHHVEDHYHDHSHDDTHDHVGDHHGHDHNHNASHHDELSEELRYSLLEVGRRDSVKVDIDLHSGDTTKAENSNVGNINVKGAWLHVLGDLIQSIGVMIGGAIIWVKPEWRVVDLICTLLFSVLVLGTTIKILRDIMEILMESTPREIDVKKLEKGLCEIPGVIAIHELHIWAITMGKTLLACHVTVYSDADTDDILQRVLGYCDRVFNISHVTVQIERHRENPPC